MLEQRRAQLRAEVQEKMRDVRADGFGGKLTEVLDAVESSEADIQEDIEFALIQMKSETLTKVHDQGNEGRSIEGQIVDARAHRTFYPSLTLDQESRTSAATCTCSAFRRSGIKEGPCEHLIALRVRYAREQARLEAARNTPEGRALITAETRVLMRRTVRGAETYRLSLDGRSVTARFGRGEPLRMQRLRFDSPSDARTAYFERLEQLAQKGYLDATQD